MLLRFGFENHLSFRDYAEISFVSTRYKDEPSYRMQVPQVSGVKHGVLPVLALYGANASGKSSALSALEFLQSEILNSHMGRRPTDPIERLPFLLRQRPLDTPSTYDCDLLLDGTRYHYGFTVNETRFLEEWLYAWPKGSKQVWFQRSEDEKEPWYFGPGFEGAKKQIASLTRDNSLFLSAAAQNNHPALLPIYRYFSEDAGFGSASRQDPLGWLEFMDRDSQLLQEKNLDVVRRLLRSADLGVGDLRVEDRTQEINDLVASSSSKDVPTDVLDRLRDVASKLREEKGGPVRLKLGHRGEGEDYYYLNPVLESLGTGLLLSHLNIILQVLQKGSLLIFDEIATGLHPRLCTALIGLFTTEETNPNGAQVLFTSHNVDLMSALRRDEIYIVEKDRFGVSTLTPVSDYKLHRHDDLRRGYVEGRFGGTPAIYHLTDPIAKLVNG